MEDKKMLDIIHNNCKKEQTRKAVERQNKINQYKEEQEYGKKWSKRLYLFKIWWKNTYNRNNLYSIRNINNNSRKNGEINEI